MAPPRTAPRSAPRQEEQREPSQRDRRIVEALVVALAAGMTASATAAAIRRLLAPLGLSAAAVAAAIRLTAKIPRIYLPPATTTSTAVNQARQDALQYRAWYLLNAARRLAEATDTKLAGQTDREALDKALAKERAYFRAHVRMQRRRFQVATAVDRMAAIYGDRLGWLAVLDTDTTLDCRHAAFKDFLVSQPPQIGFPGTVHPRCRCKPTAPWHTELLR